MNWSTSISRWRRVARLARLSIPLALTAVMVLPGLVAANQGRSQVVGPSGSGQAPPSPAPVLISTSTASPSYWMVGADGGVFAFGGAPYLGSPAGGPLNRPVVGMAGTPGSSGYWLVASDGGIFSYGNAKFYGSTGNIHLNQPIVGMAPTNDGLGYWLVASDGGIFSFGDAQFYGSTGSIHLNRPIVGMAPTADGHGYWLVASDGGIFSFGDAQFYGSTGNIALNRPIVGMAPTADGHGYWLVASDGGIFSFGDAQFYGSTGNIHLNQPIVGMASDPSGAGYWMAASDGGLFNFGDAPFRGSAASHPLAAPIVNITAADGRDPYVPGETGYDISWPQCNRALPAPPHDVSIIGINDGRPYTTNPCLADEVTWSAAGRRSVYLNLDAPVGIAVTDPRIATGGAGNCAPTDTYCQAYNWGFNASEYALSAGGAAHATTGLWWLDIETGNTWSADTFANARTIQGAVDALEGSGQQVGIYSTYYQFPKITGSYAPGLPTWIAGAPSSNPSSYCTNPSRQFGGGVPWMVQYQTDGTYDLDTAC